MDEDTGLTGLVPEKPQKPQLCVGVVPSRIKEWGVTLNAWKIIAPYVEELVKQAGGEYQAWNVLQAINDGGTNLHVGYINTTGKEMNETEQQAFVWDRLLKDPENGFAGYFLLNITNTSVHIWQAYIVKEYRQTEIFSAAFERIKRDVMTLKAPALTFAATRGEWDAVCKRMGFDSTYTIYRMDLMGK